MRLTDDIDSRICRPQLLPQFVVKGVEYFELDPSAPGYIHIHSLAYALSQFVVLPKPKQNTQDFAPKLLTHYNTRTRGAICPSESRTNNRNILF